MSQEIKVTKLPEDSGPAGWDAILPAIEPFPTLVENVHSNWVIVGAGFAGLAAARRLSQLLPTDEDVVVLEAGHLAQGTAGRNSGFMIDLPHELNSGNYTSSRAKDLCHIELNRKAIAMAAEMADEFDLDKSVFNPCGRITGAGSKVGMKHLDDYASHLSGLDEPFERLSAQYLEEMTGTSFYLGGLFTPGAAVIQPAAYVRAVSRNLHPRITFYEKSPVISITPGKCHLLRTPEGSVAASKVILAVNGHIQSFGFFLKRLIHLFTYASMTRSLTSDEIARLGGVRNWGIVPADPLGTSVRRVADYMGSGDRLLVRNHFTLNQSLKTSKSMMNKAAALHDKAFARRFPMISGVPMEYRWGGRLCLSYNSVPAFGEIEEGMYCAACQNGLGTVKGTIAGMMAAEMAVNGAKAVPSFFHEEQPSRLMPEPFLTIGATMAIKWRSFKARGEL